MVSLTCKNCGGSLKFNVEIHKFVCEFCECKYGFEDSEFLEKSDISVTQAKAYIRALDIIKTANCKEDWENALEWIKLVGSDSITENIEEICKNNLRKCIAEENFRQMCTWSSSNDIYLLNRAIELLHENPEWENCSEKIEQCKLKIEQLERARFFEEESNARKKKTKKFFRKVMVWGIMTAIIVGIIVFAVFQNRKHDADRVDVELVAMHSEYNPYDSPYIDGCYYIYFDFEIENNTYTKIDSITLTTKIKDKSGKVIYQVSSDFGGYGTSALSLEPNESGRYQTYIKEGATKTDPSFAKIYGKDISNFDITVSVDSITFSDGHNY